MAKKPAKVAPIPRSELGDQVSQDQVKFNRLGVNARRARREELEQVWPQAYLPDAEEPQLPLGGEGIE